MTADRDVEKTYSLQDFIAELRRLADALEAGEPFVIDIDGEEIVVPEDAIVSVEHEREDGREELEFQLSWEVAEDDDEDEDEEDDSDEDESDEDETADESEEDEEEENTAA